MDLITQLREPKTSVAPYKSLGGLCIEAADEIERLNTENDIMRKALETIAGGSADGLQRLQALAALPNIGPDGKRSVNR